MIRTMGVNIKMVTGDHEAIARQIAGQLKLGQNIVVADTVFGEGRRRRATVAHRRRRGFRPGVSRAQIPDRQGAAKPRPHRRHDRRRRERRAGAEAGQCGIAVSGATDAARAAADLVLTAPGLSVIVPAIEEARRIFERMNSYAIYRIAETMRLLLFMTASILIFNFYPVTAIMVVLLALLNDLPIMMIAYDNAPIARRPVRWDMTRVLTIASVLGGYGVIESFGMFWIVRDYLHLASPVVQALIFLKLLVSGHMTIYLTRNKGPVWERPWPSWKLVVPARATQLAGTLAVVYGWFMAPDRLALRADGLGLYARIVLRGERDQDRRRISCWITVPPVKPGISNVSKDILHRERKRHPNHGSRISAVELVVLNLPGTPI